MRRRRRLRWLSSVVVPLLLFAHSATPQKFTSQPALARLSLLSARSVVNAAKSSMDAFVDGLSVGPDDSIYACFSDNRIWSISKSFNEKDATQPTHTPVAGPPAISSNLSSTTPSFQSVVYNGPANAQYIASRWISAPFYALSSKPPQMRPVLALADFHNSRIDFVDPYGANATSTNLNFVRLFSLTLPSSLPDTPDEISFPDRFGGFYCSGGAGPSPTNSTLSNVTSALFYVSSFSLSLLPQDLVNVTTQLPNATLVKTLDRVTGLAVNAEGTLLYVAQTSDGGSRLWRHRILGPGVLGEGSVVLELRSDFYGSFLSQRPVTGAIRVHPTTGHIAMALPFAPSILFFHPGNATETPTPLALSNTTSPSSLHVADAASASFPELPRSLTLVAQIRLNSSDMTHGSSLAFNSDGSSLFVAGPCVQTTQALSVGKACVAMVRLGPLGRNKDLGIAERINSTSFWREPS
ncbi:hypothetical protein M427DRAFT_132015 [Gonapodya prolifera JEL478]|uniref:Calcium-dependent phosphotriesterase n=1 Tax=Gonapodya prolifera (strain JEL478) TaxID=1344416 RepID=A0A139AS66_GONPJ|nr:hypothetical protein M427DRAFT_132015 [Gonapodya prolifera JEL478]|eukprot:KXS19494.1 hypothetical protein M427DRAFT_132015 [Gonapodya prolifera JEL478]